MMNIEYSRSLFAWGPVIILLLLFSLIADHSSRSKSATFDETAHITAGYADWETGDFRLNPQNGLFSQMWVALPLTDFEFPDQNQSAWKLADIWLLGDLFLHSQSNDVTLILKKSRRMNIILGVLLGVCVFFWSKTLWGPYGGLLSLVLYTLSPLVLAHTRLATSDIAASLGFLLALLTVWRLIHAVSIKNVIYAGASLGLLALSKMSVVIMAPVIALLLAAYWSVGRKIGSGLIDKKGYQAEQLPRLFLALMMAIIIAIIIIWLPHLYGHTEYDFDWRVLDQMPLVSASLISAIKHLGFLPESYLYGLAFVLSRASERLVFVAGHFSIEGVWWFFPFSVLVKTPITTLLCGVISVVHIYQLKRQSVFALYQTSPLLVFIVAYVSIAMISGLNLGLRHLLPVYPMIFILIGVLMREATMRRLPVLVAIIGLLSLETLSVHPHYLSYFNQISGGPANGYRLLVDSSNDWGQDLPALAKWQRDNASNNNKSYLAYFGTANPASYDIQIKKLPGFLERQYVSDLQPLTAGTYIISATLLQLVYQPPHAFGPWSENQELAYQELSRLFRHDSDIERKKRLFNQYRKYEILRFARLCRYLRQRQPDEMIGYSMLVYHLDAEDIRQALE